MACQFFNATARINRGWRGRFSAAVGIGSVLLGFTAASFGADAADGLAAEPLDYPFWSASKADPRQRLPQPLAPAFPSATGSEVSHDLDGTAPDANEGRVALPSYNWPELPPYNHDCDWELERPGLSPGWFALVDFTAAKAHVNNGINSGETNSGNLPNLIQLPAADLNWNVMPRFQIGYRRPAGWGEYRIGYRFLNTYGSEALPQFGAPIGGTLSSRLRLHVLDLDYSFSELVDARPRWFPSMMRWTLGVRVASVNYRGIAAGQVLEQTADNHAVGAGPRIGGYFEYPFAGPAWRLFTDADAAGVVSSVRQNFTQIQQVAPGSASEFGGSGGPVTTAVPTAGIKAGLSWTPDRWGGCCRFSAGYQWERWWLLGLNQASNMELTVQGPFVRGEWHY